MSDATPSTATATTDGDSVPRGKLRLRDVRHLFRLINDIRETGNDPQKWRPLMVRELRRILGASIVVSSEVHFRRSAKTGSMRVIDIGWVCDSEGNVNQINTEREDERPEAFWLTAIPDEALPAALATAAVVAAPAPPRD